MPLRPGQCRCGCLHVAYVDSPPRLEPHRRPAGNPTLPEPAPTTKKKAKSDANPLEIKIKNEINAEVKAKLLCNNKIAVALAGGQQWMGSRPGFEQARQRMTPQCTCLYAHSSTQAQRHAACPHPRLPGQLLVTQT